MNHGEAAADPLDTMIRLFVVSNTTFPATLLAVLIVLATAAIAAALSAPAFAQDAAPAPTAVRVLIETSAGSILVETDPRAPITAANFLRYVDEVLDVYLEWRTGAPLDFTVNIDSLGHIERGTE